MRGRLAKLGVLAIIAFAVTASGALAYWAAGGSGSGSGSAGTLIKPVVTVPSGPVSGDIHVSWTASTLSPSITAANSQINYTVERSANSGGSWTAACGAATINGTSCSDNVGTSGNYVYRVTAHLTSSWTELSATSVPVGRRPDKPNVQGATGPTTIATVTGAAEAGSNVKLYTNSSCTTAALDALGNSGASGTATSEGSFSIQASVPAGESRTFYATSTANSMTSECSTTSASYSAPNAAPSVPSNLTAVNESPTGLTASFGNIDLSWTAVANATTYQIFRSATANAGSTGSLVGTVVQPVGGAGSTATFTHQPPSLTFGTHFYAVRAVNASGQSAFSSDASTTTRIRPPTNTTVNSTAGGSTFRVQWTAPTPVPSGTIRYNVYRATSSSGPFNVLPACSNFTPNPLRCDDNSNLVAGTTYYYRVTAFMSGTPGSESVPSNTVNLLKN